MKARFLFPHKWRLVGYLCFAADIIFSIVLKVLHPEGYAATDLSQVLGPGQKPYHIYSGVTEMRWHNDVTILLIIFGLLLVAFSKEKIEDEQISQSRLDSLRWAVYFNYALFIVCVLFIYGMHFIPVLIFNMISPLIFFIIRFRWKIYQLNRSLKSN
ncbi:hypothetical protein [Mucilaginibacter sp.]|uniref:hypothetical protein n=1 Tax=Mucilaginibacter sp. TaxID=1882438 RepID=UPI0028429EA2|nr:hypothetical protein [Mucilaginibacter sp.]MDR3696719.1 hypothetical protein [Mucilaginibacter sp.]